MGQDERVKKHREKYKVSSQFDIFYRTQVGHYLHPKRVMGKVKSRDPWLLPCSKGSVYFMERKKSLQQKGFEKVLMYLKFHCKFHFFFVQDTSRPLPSSQNGRDIHGKKSCRPMATFYSKGAVYLWKGKVIATKNTLQFLYCPLIFLQNKLHVHRHLPRSRKCDVTNKKSRPYYLFVLFSLFLKYDLAVKKGEVVFEACSGFDLWNGGQVGVVWIEEITHFHAVDPATLV